VVDQRTRQALDHLMEVVLHDDRGPGCGLAPVIIGNMLVILLARNADAVVVDGVNAALEEKRVPYRLQRLPRLN
jgi:hypothetical protein